MLSEVGNAAVMVSFGVFFGAALQVFAIIWTATDEGSRLGGAGEAAAEGSAHSRRA